MGYSGGKTKIAKTPVNQGYPSILWRNSDDSKMAGLQSLSLRHHQVPDMGDAAKVLS
jgi:hypothetical protein